MQEDDELYGAMSEERYRLLVEAVTDYAIFMFDPNGVLSSWNPGAQRFKGYRPDEIIGQNFSKFYSDEIVQPTFPSARLQQRPARAGSRTKAGRSKKTERGFELLSSSIRLDRFRESSSALRRSPAT